MRVGHVSTFWPKHCAFPAYTDGVIEGMRAHRADAHVVLAENDAAAAQNERWTCIPAFHRSQDYVDRLAALARERALDVMALTVRVGGPLLPDALRRWPHARDADARLRPDVATARRRG